MDKILPKIAACTLAASMLAVARGFPGRRVALALACALIALTVPVAAARAAPELTVLGSGPVEVKAEAGKDTAEAFVSVLNTGGEPAGVSIGFQASRSAAIKATLAGSAEIKPRQAANVGVRFTGLKGLTEKATGQIVVQGGSKPVAQSATITPALQPLVNWPLAIVIGCMGASLLLIGAIALRVLGKRSATGKSLLLGPAPGPKWSYDSWATHLTAVGALLGTVLGAVTLPAVPVQIDTESLVGLSLLFAGLAAAGPFVFQAIRSPDAKAGEEEEGNWGYTWGLLIACWLTLGAVLGELATLGLAAWVITGGDGAAVALEVGLGVLFLLAAYYVVTTANALASVDWRELARKAKQAKEEKEAQEAGERWPESVLAQALGVHSERAAHYGIRQEVAQESSRASRHLDIGSDGQAQRMTLRLP